LLRQHGMSVPDTVRHGSAKVIFESYPIVGYNYRMTDIQAAVGREQLRRLPDIVARRRELAQQYRELLAGLGSVVPPAEPAWARSNWQSYCVRLAAGQEQLRVMQAMLDAGISTRRGIMCSHREAPYAAASAAGSLGRSEQAQDNCVLLPLFGQMEEADLRRIVAALAAACGS
jgi:dTDP-4-amino-4,6-dideoxygalactose transaminase